MAYCLSVHKEVLFCNAWQYLEDATKQVLKITLKHNWLLARMLQLVMGLTQGNAAEIMTKFVHRENNLRERGLESSAMGKDVTDSMIITEPTTIHPLIDSRQ